jgi:UDP-N-acetyl-D-galactosamine dehydrogenase
MGKFIAEQTVKHMIRSGSHVKGAHVNVLGLTFKEDCPDLRNSRVIDVIRELQSYGIAVHVHDPVADGGEAHHEYGVELENWDALPQADALVVAVAHKEYLAMPLERYASKVVANGTVIDVKSKLKAEALAARGLSVWRL